MFVFFFQKTILRWITLSLYFCCLESNDKAVRTKNKSCNTNDCKTTSTICQSTTGLKLLMLLCYFN